MFFNNIIGQKPAINTFKQILESNRLSHFYIFAGPSGVGKFLFARTLAKILLCEKDGSDWTEKGCMQCRSCRWVGKNSHPNLRIIEVEKDGQKISIDVVREIERELMLAPFQKSYRVFIINEAEKMSEEACNGFLKTLEEPAKNTVIILVTSSLSSFPQTVLSRCQLIKFYPIAEEVMQKYLEEHLKMKSQEAGFLTYLSDGSIGDAYRIHQRDLLTQRSRLIDALMRDSRSDIPKIIINYAKAKSGKNKEEERQEIIWQLKIIGLIMRDVLYLHNGLSESNLLNRDKIREIKHYQKRCACVETERICEKILRAERYIRANANVSLVVENLFY
ncbi:MAG: DNA polymerase III subunit delta' [Planctomycetota bacterium]|nr:DNA polymerase III subunit delta' [Planctomycetota bacterium]MDI6787783.1 DNA polymerase III subunit delta' [Planctomycetota bacterium]